MKKILVLFLALAMLLPMAFLQPAKADVAKDPFYALNWDPVDEGKFSNIYAALKFWTSASVEYKISWDGTSFIPDLATKTYELFKYRPEGTRFINFGFPPRVYMTDHVENHVYLDEGAYMVKDWLSNFLSAYSSLGGELDGLILDTEISSMNAKNLQSVKTYKEIVADPRYKTDIRPLLEERDFPFYVDPTGETPEISSIHNNLTGETYDRARTIWDQVMQYRVARYLNTGVSKVLWEYYPDAMVSDFQSTDRDGWYKFPTNTGALYNSGANTVQAGNTSNYNAYNSRPGSSFYKDADGNYLYNTPCGYNGAIYEESAFHMALWDVNYFKNIYASTNNKNISAWVSSYNKGSAPAAYSPYATEMIYHLGMLNPQPYLGFVVKSEAKDVDFNDRLAVLNEQIAEVSRVAGFADREPIEVPANWNESFLLSGMFANGRNIWRITPDTTKVSLEAFKTGAKDPTFRVEGKTITFPGGKIIADTAITAVGSCGYWVETAANVNPIVTADKDRFEKYPALTLGFEDCEAGTFDPKGAWEITGSAKITDQSGSKALTLEGDTAANCVKLPGNITAGDTYAENQVWEVALTLSKTDGTIQLLRYAGENQAKADGGFKLENGTLYYSKKGEYVELSKLTPGTYTFRRTVDFSDPAAFLSTYEVQNSKGTVLATAADIPTPGFTKITSIGFATKNATAALDAFSICIAGKAADFTLYDVLTGLQVADPKAAQTQDTAYRLSWLNASNKTETAKVQAEIYEGGKLKETKTVKTVTMEPGCDGVEAGIVEVADGQSIKVKLIASYMPAEPEPTEPTEEPTLAPTKAPTRPSIPSPTIITAVRPPKVTTAPTTASTTASTQETAAPTQATQTTEVTQITEVTQATKAPETTDTTKPVTAATAPQKPEAESFTPNVWMIVVISVVVLAAAGTAVYILIRNKKKA